MFHWYSLNGSATYFNEKIFKDKNPQKIWMVICGTEHNKLLKCYESEESAIANGHIILNMELELCELGYADLSRNLLTIKFNDCSHTFQMKNGNQTDFWYSRLSTMICSVNNTKNDVLVNLRERTTSASILPIQTKLKLQRQLTPFIPWRSSVSLEKPGKEPQLRSVISDCIYSNCTSTSLDFSDDVFYSNMSRSILKDHSDKSCHMFTEGFFRENDLMYLFDTIRDKANQQISEMKSEILLTKIDFLENVLHHLISCDANDIKSRYGKKIKSILESEREENPTLPTFSKLPNIDYFVDNYGFKHSLEEDSHMRLICQKLIDHLKLKSQSQNYCVRLFHETINSPCLEVDRLLEIINNYSFVGFPTILRKTMWNLLATYHLKKIEFPVTKTNNYFVMLLQQTNNIDIDVKRIIKVESYKMYNQNIFFDQIDSTKIRGVQNVLMAIYVRNSVHIYSHLLMKISALTIMILDPAEVFRLLVAISESMIGSKIMNQSFQTSFIDQIVLKELLSQHHPDLQDHMLKINADISFLTKRWIENIFIDCLPFETSLKIFDIFLIKGQEWIIIMCFVIIRLEAKKLLVMNKAFDIYKYLNTRYNHLYDIDYILEETLKLESTFTNGFINERRKDLHENYKRTNCDVLYQSHNSDTIRFQDNSAAFRHIIGKIECTSYNNECIFIAVAGMSHSLIYVLNFLRGFVKDTSIKVAFFVSVMISTKSFLLVASEGGFVSSFDYKEKHWLWKVTLQNCPLDMVSIGFQLFIGLDNGSLAIIENLSSKNTNCTFHLHVSSMPIYKLVYSNSNLICATKDCLLIIDPSTTSIVNKIQLCPESPLQDLKIDKNYLWLVYKGSTIIQLWNIETCLQICSQNISHFQGRRTINGSVTILNPIIGQHQLWIATDTGEMFIFDVKCSMIREVPLHDSNLQLNNSCNSWECHQSVIDKVTGYLSSMDSNSPQSCVDDPVNEYQTQTMHTRNRNLKKRLSVTMIDNDFVDISIMGDKVQQVQSKSKNNRSHFVNHDDILELDRPHLIDIFSNTQSSLTPSDSNEEIHLKQKIFLSLKGGMKISDSPIQHICTLIQPNDIGEAFITMSSYMEEENNMVIWKQGTQGWKYKVMHYQSLERSENFFSRFLQKINLPLI